MATGEQLRPLAPRARETPGLDANAAMPGRGLSTARAVLKVLALLAEHPEGMRACEVAAGVGKSSSTAYYLLNSLVEEGFAEHTRPSGRYRLSARAVALRHPEPGARSPMTVLDAALDRLFALTRKRCYAGRVMHGTVSIVGARGRQGLPRIPGLHATITDALHALAMGKVVLSELPEPARRRYAEQGLTAYTPATITAPAALLDALDTVRVTGLAEEAEEFHRGFCCIAAPMRDPDGRFIATLGLSVTTRSFEREHDQLTDAVLSTASSHLQKSSKILSLPRAGSNHYVLPLASH
jgi:DNA-binding IclR family transcriptional regulator